MKRVALLSWALPLLATLVPSLSFRQVIQQSGIVVRGRVSGSYAAWGPERKFIWTHYQVAVAEVLKGPALRRILVSEPGGIIDGRIMTIPGVPSLPMGKEFILFLYRTPIGYWRIVGFGQGCFEVANGRTRGLSLPDFRRRIDTEGK